MSLNEQEDFNHPTAGAAARQAFALAGVWVRRYLAANFGGITAINHIDLAVIRHVLKHNGQSPRTIYMPSTMYQELLVSHDENIRHSAFYGLKFRGIRVLEWKRPSIKTEE